MQQCPLKDQCELSQQLTGMRETERLSYERRYCNSLESSMLCVARSNHVAPSVSPTEESQANNPRIRIL